MSTTTTETNLDSLLNELVQSADEWASMKADLLESPASPCSRDEQPQHPCFDQLSRAISSHVTDLLMRRLRLNSRQEDDADWIDDEDRPWIDERGRERRGGQRPATGAFDSASSLRSSRCSLSSRESPSGSVVSGRHGTTATSANGRPSRNPVPHSARVPPTVGYSQQSLSNAGSRYHSENRLDKNYPTPRRGETPLENRASRLRRMSIERKQKEAAVSRSAAASPMPARRSLSRRSSGYGGR